MRLLFHTVTVTAVFMLSAAAQHEPPPAVGTAPSQPIPFSHRAHVSLGLKCAECHKSVATANAATLPAEAICMACHRTIKANIPPIALLADHAKAQKRIPWVRLYRLPDFVYFSHKRHHGKGQLECALCHGNVGESEILRKEKSIGMQSCMACHDRLKVSNNCDTCHDPHPN